MTPLDSPLSYPSLPQVLDQESLLLLGTFAADEEDFVLSMPRPRQRYLTGLYLKAIGQLGHSHVQPHELPRQLRLRVAERFDLKTSFAQLTEVSKSSKSRIVAAVRRFLGLRVASRRDMESIEAWLRAEVARKEADPAVIAQGAIERFRSLKIELPSPPELHSLVRRAAHAAEASVLAQLNRQLTAEDGSRLDALLDHGPERSWLDWFKTPCAEASTSNLARELRRLEQLQGFLPSGPRPAAVSLRRSAQLARLAARYQAGELRQLKASRRRPLLYCYATERCRQLLDAVVDQTLRVWEQSKTTATNHATDEQTAWATVHEQHRQTLRKLVGIILDNPSQFSLWRAIQAFRNSEQLEALYTQLQATPSWTSAYVDKLEDHYCALRRFLPDLYRLVPIVSTTTDDTLPDAWRFACRQANAGETTLPVKDCPTAFLAPPWQGRALRRQRRSGELVRIVKVPYELGLLEASSKAFKEGSLAVVGAQRYAPLTDHLLPRAEFLSNYAEHTGRLGFPPDAQSYCAPIRKRLEEGLSQFDQHYDEHCRTFWVHRDGTLGFSRVRGEGLPRRAKRLRDRLASRLPEVSILDVLLDCHRWTGFIDCFQTSKPKQEPAERESIPPVLGALYAYGCYCGPTQAARSLGLSKDQVMYARRRHMPLEALQEAARRLADAYQRTAAAQRLADPGVLLTDSMQLRTLKSSLIARQHHRYRDGKSTLLYQHITPDLICQFTQATLCNVSEGIRMLVGARQCRRGDERLVNICDTAGKSHRGYGLGSLMNIDLYARLRSRNVKLWAAGPDAKYEHITDALAGAVNWQRIEQGWQDMIWIVASIEAGVAKPEVILERLASQPNHPADRGFIELGKALQSCYALRYGMEMDLRRYVIPYTARREHWNKFTREVRAFGETLREKTLEEQEEVFWCLTVVQNAIVLWNALALEHVLATSTDVSVDDPDLAHIWPTMTGHINFVGRFLLNLRRRPPFRMRLAS